MEPLTSDAIKRLGGFRPIAVASEHTYAFGKWRGGFYPVMLTRSQPRPDVASRWKMFVHGFECIEEPTLAGLTRLLKAIDPLTEPPK